MIRALHLGWTAKGNRKGSLAGLAVLGGDVSQHLRPEEADDPGEKLLRQWAV